MPPKREKLLVVVDTNIIVSGLIFKKGSSSNVIKALKNGKFDLIISGPLFSEYKQVLPRKKFTVKYKLTNEEITDFIVLVDSITKKATPLNKLPVKVRDSKDEIVLKTAMGGEADYLVTGDNDLLILNGNPALGKLKIISVKDFLKIL